MPDKSQPCTDGPVYFPLQMGRYEVKPGFYKFSHDFGNGDADRLLFQIDSSFQAYRQEKLAARAERLGKYYCRQGFDNSTASTINQFIIRQLVREHPARFQLQHQNKEMILSCRLSQDVLTFDRGYCLQNNANQQSPSPDYVDSFDALASQVQEDIAVIRVTETGEDQIIALHLCLPNHWAAEDKIGQNFIATHRPVPEMDKINPSARQLLHAIIHKGPYVRFAWGIATDQRLNHHPEPAPPNEAEQWQGRAFDPLHPELYLRVERQTLHGFAAEQLALFTIRTYVYDIHTLARIPDQKTQLISAINSMSEDSLVYKGLKKDKKAILEWLQKIGLGTRD